MAEEIWEIDSTGRRIFFETPKHITQKFVLLEQLLREYNVSGSFFELEYAVEQAIRGYGDKAAEYVEWVFAVEWDCSLYEWIRLFCLDLLTFEGAD